MVLSITPIIRSGIWRLSLRMEPFGYFFVSESQGFHANAYRLVEKLMNFRLEILLNPDMEDRILSKYELKNTCGYGMSSFLDYTDPYDILMHLMVGSEGP